MNLSLHPILIELLTIGFSFDLTGRQFWIFLGLFWLVGDVFFRAKLAEQAPRSRSKFDLDWLITREGGTIMFIPAWAAGILLPLLVFWI